MLKTAIRLCPICDNNDVDFLHYQKFMLPEGHPLSDGYSVVCCEKCGFVYADTAVTQHDYDGFYAKYSKYEDNKTSGGGATASWDLTRLQETASTIAHFLPTKNARILDVGCANGGLLACLKNLGYDNLCGIDPSPTCATNTRQQYNIEAYTGSLSALPIKIGLFDCVTLSHVFEHICELKDACEALIQLVKPGGLVYMEVPDATRYTDYSMSPFQDFNTEHINHFSQQCMSNLLQQYGLVCENENQKTILSAPNMPYPATYGIYRKLALVTNLPPLVKDVTLKSAINAYIVQSQKVLDIINLKIQKALQTSEEVIVWGTGQLAMKLLAETSLAGAKVAAFVDGNPINQGKMLRGSPILAPEQVKDLSGSIIITSILHQQEISEVIRNKIGLTNKLVLLGDSTE